jgi:hypothetical protein
MMGRLDHGQEQFFYSFRFDEVVPDGARACNGFTVSPLPR